MSDEDLPHAGEDPDAGPYTVERVVTIAEQRHISANRPVVRDEWFRNEGGAVTDAIVWRECWEENVYRLEPHMLTGGWVLDVGANVGAFTSFALAMNDEERVLSVEPDPDNLARLHETIRMNGWEARSSIAETALGDYDGVCTITAGGGASNVSKKHHGETRMTRPRTLLHELGLDDSLEFDFFKMDCEGGEYDIIHELAAEDMMKNFRWLSMEFHTTDHESFGEMLALLCDTHSVSGIIGRAGTGGQLWAHRHDV